MITNFDLMKAVEANHRLLTERLPDPANLVEAIVSPTTPLRLALDVVVAAFEPPPITDDEATAIAAVVALCATSDSEPQVVPTPASCAEPASLLALLDELNRCLYERRLPVLAYLRASPVPAAIMVRRIEYAGRKR